MPQAPAAANGQARGGLTDWRRPPWGAEFADSDERRSAAP